ncbi:MAG TPA: hemerythrin domain-containing protein [Candidatus Dormibacteraeota bacterium]|nr:hemerythrin domain-containing protein [Candidatus Dormibacteraeota bacterium]
MSDFIHELKHDHRVIQQVVAGMSAVAELLDSGKQVDPSVLAELVQFLRVFADQCHHEKEGHLFPLLAANANLSTRHELESLEREHRSAKQLVGQLAKVAAVYVHSPGAVRYRIVDLLQQLVELYPAHIWKEDFLLFPLAQRNLSPAEQRNLEEKFESVEREVGKDVHAGFEILAKKLEAVVEYRDSGACPLCSAAA